MNDDKYDRISWVIKQTGRLIVDLELDDLHTRQKIERLHALIQELEDFREQYEREQTEQFWQEPTKNEAELPVIDSDAA